MRKMSILVALLVVTGLAAPAAAELVPVGDPWDYGSWGARFGENGVVPDSGTYTFDFVGVRFTSAAGAFEGSGLTNFSDSHWSSWTSSDARVASASGHSIAYLEWDFHFAGSSSTPIQFDYFFFSGNTLRGSQHMTWQNGWTYPYFVPTTTVLREEFLPAPVPFPSVASASLTALGLLALLRRRA
ncbi:MAG: hypothetical protein NTU53_23365 [Planctomycetota bacterium]|nr:hypothetical protein [Planctomycetota bacterium]